MGCDECAALKQDLLFGTGTETNVMMIVFAVFLIAALFVLPRLLTKWIVDRTPEKPEGTRFFWPSVFLLGIGVIFLADFGWLLFVIFWCGVWIWRLAPRWTCVMPLLCGLAIGGAHVQGYKFYGVPQLADNRPLLPHPLELARLELPNTLVAKDGSRHKVAGFEFRQSLADLSPEEQLAVVDRLRKPLLFLPDASYPSGYVAERRIDYFCGNSFFPSFLPARLPTHEKRDMAVALRWLAADPEKPGL
ncbi:hypothetical protein BH11VER1_BH11VER1_20990 [soil metagenome]